MVTAELTPPPDPPRRAAAAALRCTTVLWIITAAAALAAGVDPGLASARHPHPVLRLDVGAWLAIVANNTRVLGLPLLLALLDLSQHRHVRRIADAGGRP